MSRFISSSKRRDSWLVWVAICSTSGRPSGVSRQPSPSRSTQPYRSSSARARAGLYALISLRHCGS
jgi:hypothetical protein